jgi:Rrf2 family protein
MFKIHKKVKYALIVLKYMKERSEQELITAKEMCAKFDIPFDPTSRVLQIMTQNGILSAEQGAYGGYRLVGDLSKISILDLSKMITGSVALTDCCTEEAECERMADCVIKDPIGKLNLKLLTVLKTVRVSEMV